MQQIKREATPSRWVRSLPVAWYRLCFLSELWKEKSQYMSSIKKRGRHTDWFLRVEIYGRHRALVARKLRTSYDEKSYAKTNKKKKEAQPCTKSYHYPPPRYTPFDLHHPPRPSVHHHPYSTLLAAGYFRTLPGPPSGLYVSVMAMARRAARRV